MKITQIESHVLRLPLARPIAASMTAGDPLAHVFLLLVHVDTDAGHRGFGYSFAIEGGGRALRAIVEDDLMPLLMGENPLDHERLQTKVSRRLFCIGRHGLVRHAYAAIDLALWDLKGRVAGLPLYKLLGGARDGVPAYAADIGWLSMSAEQIIEAAQAALKQGLMGVKLKIGQDDLAKDAERLHAIRDALGEDVWIAVDANQRYDYTTALAMGRILDELGIDWFEEPLSCEDIDGHARLRQALEVPVALGESLASKHEFHEYLRRDAVDIVQPDIVRVGGLTEWLKIAALAETYHRPIAPHLMPETCVHLACAFSSVRAVELMPWFYPAFIETPAVQNGLLVPPSRAGLGLEPKPEAITKYRVDW